MNLRHHNSSRLSWVTAALLVFAAPGLLANADATEHVVEIPVPPEQQVQQEQQPAATGAVEDEASPGLADSPLPDELSSDEPSSNEPSSDEQPSLDQPHPPAFSDQPEDEAADPELLVHTNVENLLAAYQAQIDHQQALNGTYHPSLAESLTSMAQLLQLRGEHEAAITAYQRAQHIRRVNDGIYSVSQEPMLRGMIDSYAALGNLESVGDHFDQLLWLYGRDYGADDPRLLPLVSEISNWHLQAYSYNPNRKAVRHLVRAHELVANTIERISHRVGGGNLTVLPLLHNLVVTNYYLADHQRRYPVGSRDGFSMRTSMGGMSEPLTQDELLAINSYQNGRRAQESIIATLAESPNVTTLELVEALAGLGDWHLLFGRTNSAQQAYRQAWEIAESDPATNPLLPELFGAPQLLALQPTSSKGATIVDPESEDAVRIFTRLTIGTRGDVRSSEIVEIQPAESEELSSTATRELRKLRFRPRLIDGTMSSSEGVEYTLALRP